MKPVKFPGHNMTLAEKQPQYQPLPVCYHGGAEGAMTSCWKFTFWERIKLLFLGRIHLTQLTFNQSFQPQRPEINWKEPICKGCGNGIGKHNHINRECPTKYKEGVCLRFYHPEFKDGKWREGTIKHEDGLVYVELNGENYPLNVFTFVNA